MGFMRNVIVSRREKKKKKVKETFIRKSSLAYRLDDTLLNEKFNFYLFLIVAYLPQNHYNM